MIWMLPAQAGTVQQALAAPERLEADRERDKGSRPGGYSGAFGN